MFPLVLLPFVFIATFVFVFSVLMLQRNSSKTKVEFIADGKLPRELRQRLVDRDKEYFDAGFEFCHNRITKRRGSICYARYYLHIDRLTMACDCVCTDTFRTQRLFPTAMKSVLEDGTIVEISSNDEDELTELFHGLTYESRLRVHAAGTTDVDELHDSHDGFLATAVADLNCQPIEIYSDMISELDEYTLNLVDWEMYRRGMITNEPGPLSFSQELTTT